MRSAFTLLFALFAVAACALSPAADNAFTNQDYATAIAILQQESEQDSTDAELWRALGFALSRNDNPAEALKAYDTVLELQPADYDATLAAARLHILLHQPQAASLRYEQLLEADSTDVEALWGLADVAEINEDYALAVLYLQRSLDFLPRYIPTLMKLARFSSYINELDNAIAWYKNAIDVEPTMAEAWSGVGRMYWWKGEPYSAVKWYAHAIQLDAANTELLDEWKKVRQEMKWNGQSKLAWISEEEDDSTIYTLTQKYQISRLLSNRIFGSVSSLWQWNRKEYAQSTLKEEKWVDETSMRLQWRGPHLWRAGGSVGATKDGTLTRGMIDISGSTRVFGILLQDAIVAGQEQFSHWYHLNHRFVDNHFELSWKRWQYSVDYRAGYVEKTYIRHDTQLAENPFVHYSWQLSHLLYKPMNLKLNCYWKRMDFTYSSNRYYTPQDRRLWGGGTSLYYPIASWYVYGSGAIEQDSDGEIGYNADAELGWQQHGVSLSVGGGMFHNPWYTSRTISVSVGLLW